MDKLTNEIDKEEKYFYMLLSESSLHKTWDNEYDNKWDDFFKEIS